MTSIFDSPSKSNSLDGTMFEFVHTVFRTNNDYDLCQRMTIVLTIYTVITFLQSFMFPAPYGRHSKSTFGPTMNAKLAWMVQESPAFIVPIIIWNYTPMDKLHLNNFVPLAFFMLHYFQRSFVYPLRMTTAAKPVPVLVMIMAFLFTSFNGFLQSLYLGNVAESYAEFDTIDMLALIGFLCGMWINFHHDGVLMSLKKSKTGKGAGNEYQIPRGFLFEYISGANYLGEVIEWWCIAKLTGFSYPMTVFAIFSTSFLGMRAWQHHQWYKSTFGKSYPSSRKAIIPFLL